MGFGYKLSYEKCLKPFGVQWKFLVHKGLQIQLTHLLNYFDVK